MKKLVALLLAAALWPRSAGGADHPDCKVVLCEERVLMESEDGRNTALIALRMVRKIENYGYKISTCQNDLTGHFIFEIPS